MEKIHVKNGENSRQKMEKIHVKNGGIFFSRKLLRFLQVQDSDWAGVWNLPEWIYAFHLRTTDSYGTAVRKGHWFILE